MQGIIPILLLFCFIAIVKSQPAENRQCTSSDQCGKDACCVAESRRRARRFIFGSSTGTCHPKRYQGQACHVYLHHDFGNPGMFLNYCPCDEGLVCRGQTVEGHGDSVIHHNPVCVPDNVAMTSTTTAPPTVTS